MLPLPQGDVEKDSGIKNFIYNEKQKWKCQSCCGEIVSVHRESCLFCGQLKTKDISTADYQQ